MTEVESDKAVLLDTYFNNFQLQSLALMAMILTVTCKN